ncbi:MAG: tRNA (guanosine(46)-N7)-methyltransferase TrmB [Actinobacteria bacterium]|jgi:tRNA (guanine-N7-)-methyltransferase|uniref:tRNA (guanine(46)-N(7))-methyltransferase n=1 Tax=freshwater metagenome TaxID=449393 RepID=A0A6J7VF21_9ZZZZ|nr:tRNA (guanosine(46)-N7)-methyltransferase TrmB [Actinomycetota bacterium]MSY35240.1 tRNA (guanosine(46)-N7)-methyltransferase TrmB [Actinomycetota bacterium]MTA72626.1 tRNA (guanosine(46)-N7)-methyltransferase TrmB [Actinomycetota bacterium]MTB29662.1 tRNA (guanosine(46)-N7)-methyltransferase TrmB [Actinomycetota bacterium]
MERPSIRSYSIRGTRITEAQRAAKKSLQEVHGIPVADAKLDLHSIFPNAEKIIMEIGFGMGEATAIIALASPNNGYLAVDLHPPGIGKLLSRIQEQEITNIKVIEDDVHVVLPYMIDDAALDGVHLYFPDPWPKVKHHKRRIVNAGFLELVASKLKPGGYFHLATDWVPYAESMENVFKTSTQFSGGVIDKPDWRPVTRFEGQGIDKDHRVTDLLYFRN